MIVRSARFHELVYEPRLLACQQNAPAPSNVNGGVLVDVTGLQAPPQPSMIAGYWTVYVTSLNTEPHCCPQLDGNPKV